MNSNRRRFLLASGATVLGLAGTSSVEAASAARSVTYVSDWRLRKIARQLALGVGYQLASALEPRNLARFLESGEFAATLHTLESRPHPSGMDLDVVVDDVRFHLDGVPQPLTLARKFLADLALNVSRVFDKGEVIDQQDFRQLIEEIIPKLDDVLADASMELTYRIRYQHVVLNKLVRISRGHLRTEAQIRQPVGQLNSLSFIVDAQEGGGQTTITTSLALDVCIGRREGCLVRRIAGRIIGDKESQVLCQLQGLVYRVIHRTEDPARLREIIPELIRRAEEQQF